MIRHDDDLRPFRQECDELAEPAIDLNVNFVDESAGAFRAAFSERATVTPVK